MTALLAALVTSVLGSPLNDAPALELRYTGIIDQVSRNGKRTPTKQVEIYCLLGRSNEERQLSFVVEERGPGGWAWPERFGEIVLDDQNRPTNGARIQLLNEFEGVLYPLTTVQPVFEFADKLQPEAEWKVGRSKYQVTGSGERNDRDCWQVEVTTNFGRSHTIWIETESAIVVAVEQRFFMGRGDQFRLSLELENAAPLNEEDLARVQPVTATLARLQAQLERKEGATDPDLSDEQLATAESVLEQLTSQAEGTPFHELATAIRRDVESQRQRSGDVHRVAGQLVGRPAPEFELTGLDGKPIASGDRADKIVVLHFWKYHGEPLTEPYGQVGYLDFLNNRRQKLGVQIYGVAVDPRLGDQGSKSAAVRQIRKLQEFMNLSYPIALDDGALVKAFGDPQRLGANLPLWVVIDHQGNVAHYRTGHYETKPQEGLRELDGVLAELLRKQRKKD